MGIADSKRFESLFACLMVQRYQDADGKIIDHKFHIKPNILCCAPRNAFPFWKGVIQATKLGYRWNIENGRRVTFWEDV
jgi:hypothetical protein